MLVSGDEELLEEDEVVVEDGDDRVVHLVSRGEGFHSREVWREV